MNELRKMIFNEKSIKYIVKGVNTRIRRNHDDALSIVTTYENNIKTISTQIQNILVASIKGDIQQVN